MKILKNIVWLVLVDEENNSNFVSQITNTNESNGNGDVVTISYIEL